MATLETIQHKIVSVDTTHGSIQVNYSTSIIPAGLTYQIDLTLDQNGNVVSGQALTDLINQYAPIGQLTDAENVVAFLATRQQEFAGKDFSAIQAMVQAPSPSQPISNGAQTL